MNKRIKTIMRSRLGGASIAMMVITFSLVMVGGSYLGYSVANRRMTHRDMDFQQARILAQGVARSARLQFIKIKTDGSDDTQLDLPEFPAAFSQYVPVLDITQSGSQFFITAGVSNSVTGVKAAVQEVVEQSGGAGGGIRGDYTFFYNDDMFLDVGSEFAVAEPGASTCINGDLTISAEEAIVRGASVMLKGEFKIGGELYFNNFDHSANFLTRSNFASNVFMQDAGNAHFLYDMNEFLVPKPGVFDWQVVDSTNPRFDEINSSPIDKYQGYLSTGNGEEIYVGSSRTNAHALIEPRDGTAEDVKLADLTWNDPHGLYIKLMSDGTLKFRKYGDPNYPNYTSVAPSQYASITGKNRQLGTYNLNSYGAWVDVHDHYYDPREGGLSFTNGPSAANAQRFRMVDLYMRRLSEFVHQNTKFIYVEMEDQSDGLIPAVRLRNGYIIQKAHAEGLTIATHRSLFVEGNFNTVKTFPIMIACDNLTFLSRYWRDNHWDTDSADTGSQNLDGGSTGNDTSIYATILAGYNRTLPPAPGDYSVSGQNVIRLRERWTGDALYCWGRIWGMWEAQESNCLVGGGTYAVPRYQHYKHYAPWDGVWPPGFPEKQEGGYSAVHWKDTPYLSTWNNSL